MTIIDDDDDDYDDNILNAQTIMILTDFNIACCFQLVIRCYLLHSTWLLGAIFRKVNPVAH